MSTGSLVMLVCGVCKENTIHRLNACIHCGAVHANTVMVLDHEASYRRMLRIDSGGTDTRSRRAAKRRRSITIHSKTTGHGNTLA